MATDIAAKLYATSVALGCKTRKELCARFRAVNPTTQCDLDRLNKWMQGRAEPRATQVYADWAGVLRLNQPASWIAECGLDAFLAALSGASGLAIDTLRGPPQDRARPPAEAVPGVIGLFGGAALVCGQFACYSPAWSPFYKGKLIRGSLTIRQDESGGLVAEYRETLRGVSVALTGPARITGRTLHLNVIEPNSQLPVHMSLLLPGAPADMLCGVMAGSTFISLDAMPAASRIILVRAPDGPALHGSNRYLDAAAGVIATDLAELGVVLTEGETLAMAMLGFLVDSVVSATALQLLAMAGLLDPSPETGAGRDAMPD